MLLSVFPSTDIGLSRLKPDKRTMTDNDRFLDEAIERERIENERLFEQAGEIVRKMTDPMMVLKLAREIEKQLIRLGN